MRSFNQVFVREALGGDVLAAALDHFRGRDRFRLRVREDVRLDPGLLSRAGLMRRGGIPSMALESPGRQDAARLDVRPISDERTLGDHVLLVASAFDWDPRELAAVFTRKILDDPVWRGWVGYSSGEPACTSQLVVDGDTAGIYYVATAEHLRGRGYGGLMSRYAVEEAARRGCRIVGLQPSPMGRSVYDRLGFRIVAQYETYVPA